MRAFLFVALFGVLALPTSACSSSIGASPPPPPPCDAECQDQIALRSLREGMKLVYNLTLQGKPVGPQDATVPCPLGGSAHVFNAALSYDFGRGWRAGARVTVYSGLPRAPDPTSDATRLDAFFRLDLRLEKKWTLAKGFWISAVAEWMNVTMTKESFGTSCTLQGCTETKIGPITIPSLGVEGGF